MTDENVIKRNFIDENVFKCKCVFSLCYAVNQVTILWITQHYEIAHYIIFVTLIQYLLVMPPQVAIHASIDTHFSSRGKSGPRTFLCRAKKIPSDNLSSLVA